MAILETPSRIWRRIQAADEGEPPSLPSLPAFDDSGAQDSDSDQHSTDDGPNILPVHSTPAAVSAHTATSTIRLQSSTSSTARFASSLASRSVSAKSSSASRTYPYPRSPAQSFEVSSIASFPHESDENTEPEDSPLAHSRHSVPESHLPPEEHEMDDMSVEDALQSVSRSSSPFSPEIPLDNPTPRKKYDYSMSLRSEPQRSPFDKYRNVALRKPFARTRTPSLSRTTPSPVSSPPNSTPRSNRSIPLPIETPSPTPGVYVPLPRSRTASPAVTSLPSVMIQPPEDESNDEQELSPDHSQDPSQESDPEPGREDSATQSDREPTFSSASSDPNNQINNDRTIGAHSTAFLSPARSVLDFTPVPRLRTQFNIPPAYNELGTDAGEEPLTPHTRRRSFLLSVINSTARPRIKFTPHPHNRLSALPVSQSSSGSSESASGVGVTPAGPMRTAFAGITPRPGRGRARMSHPLAQAHAPDSASSAGDSEHLASPSDIELRGASASFISTASSHDLTTHPRANTSYDPALGTGQRGVARFDAPKLNHYLHTLNSKLQEENKALVDRLRKYEEVKDADQRRLSLESMGSGKARRVSAGSALGDVEEAGEEGWAEEKKDLEELVENLEAQLDKLAGAKESVDRDLETERHERARDKERWRERMHEVESGVAEIVGDLEQKVVESEQALEEMTKEAERIRERLQSERDLALERAGQAETVMENGKELGGALKEANTRISVLTADLQSATAQIKDLEDEIMTSDRRVDELEKELKKERLSAKLANDDLHGQLSEMGGEIMRSNARASELEKDFQAQEAAARRLQHELEAKGEELAEAQQLIAQSGKDINEEVRELRTYTAELEEAVTATTERIQDLEEQLTSAQDHFNQLETEEQEANNRAEALEKDNERASLLVNQMEEALEAAEQKMRTDQEVIADLKAKISTLEREREREREMSRLLKGQHSDESNAELENVLEAELEQAHKEIARLTELLQHSPARKAIDAAKDQRIEMLEKDKEQLQARIKALRSTSFETATPNKVVNLSGISPIHRHVLSMSVRAPKTPGGPLKDLSWLNNTTGDASVSPLLSEIARLQTELDLANDSIDQKLDELEDAGLGVVSLTRDLELARSKISQMENEMGRLQRREDRRLHRLQRLRCQKCMVKVDTSTLQRFYDADESFLDVSHSGLPSNPPTPPTKTSEALRLDLHAVNKELDTMKQRWEEEKRHLLGERAVLQDAANRMNMEVRSAKDEAKRATEASRRSRADTREVEKAKAVIADLEAELQAERTRLRQMSTEQNRVQREKSVVARQLQRTEADIDDVKRHLQKAKRENNELETELRTNATIEQQARLLEGKVKENAETIDQLRQERSLLAKDHKELQRQFTEVSERVNKLRNDYARSQSSHDKRRHQLDSHLGEIDDLRRALSNQADELQRSEEEKNRMAIEKTDVARTVAALESDLRRVKRDAEAFGRDLKTLRTEKEKLHEKHRDELTKAERAKKQAQTQIRLLNEQLAGQHTKLKTAQEKLKIKDYGFATNGYQLVELKNQHKEECKGLVVQIRYLKAKFTRESTLRDDLAYQKQYLLVLLSSFEASEKRILACISRIGYPKPKNPPAVVKKPRSIKSVVLSVIFIRRVRQVSEAWREASSNKQAISNALQEVRRRRAIAATS
ncbi:hypothetical protein EV702DRAFT_1126979 [Suillus placidus]|uniref:Pericentrin/AKAP-450 centrosomal targeting domain-containing protein n=1 Tax=Suillus placidus TaxID=48579 RepID=A0A9P6ZPI0_9AGAM|nr:hypothetical protein EV702DRAFT_1126979 [Suillus placidus]